MRTRYVIVILAIIAASAIAQEKNKYTEKEIILAEIYLDAEEFSRNREIDSLESRPKSSKPPSGLSQQEIKEWRKEQTETAKRLKKLKEQIKNNTKYDGNVFFATLPTMTAEDSVFFRNVNPTHRRYGVFKIAQILSDKSIIVKHIRYVEIDGVKTEEFIKEYHITGYDVEGIVDGDKLRFDYCYFVSNGTISKKRPDGEDATLSTFRAVKPDFECIEHVRKQRKQKK